MAQNSLSLLVSLAGLSAQAVLYDVRQGLTAEIEVRRLGRFYLAADCLEGGVLNREPPYLGVRKAVGSLSFDRRVVLFQNLGRLKDGKRSESRLGRLL